nr:mitochondrial import inner membrane translocase subunit tim54 [Quercus suber]
MSDKPSTTPAAENAAGAASSANASSNAGGGASSTAAPKKPLPEGNPALRMMGIPRLRLPSRNWMIFLSITGGFASAVMYDKWQTRRNREKWCQLVSHIADEPLSTKSLPRRMTIYLAAPPGDGLRCAREHFYDYVKPVLVAAAMDWDVIEGRKEGDVRYKTAERIRKKRRRAGEGNPVEEEELETDRVVDEMRKKSGTVEYDGIAGDLVIGRNTWKEYVRGLHEGWLGSADAPQDPIVDPSQNAEISQPSPAQPSLTEAVTETGADAVVTSMDAITGANSSDSIQDQNTEQSNPEEATKPEAKEEEKPKRRFPAPYIDPSEYQTASLSQHAPDMIGPSAGIQFPHLLGIRNTPIRIWRFLNRRRLADDVGRQVASAILASHRSYGMANVADEESASGTAKSIPEQNDVLAHEERNWWKTTYNPRAEHEESVWIEDMVLDERLASRMQVFQLDTADEERAKRIANGTEQIKQKGDEGFFLYGIETSLSASKSPQNGAVIPSASEAPTGLPLRELQTRGIVRSKPCLSLMEWQRLGGMAVQGTELRFTFAPPSLPARHLNASTSRTTSIRLSCDGRSKMSVAQWNGEKAVVYRKYAPKTRTGCLTCKCDEAKPHCNRCVSTGRKCDGYALSSRSPPTVSVPDRQSERSRAVPRSLETQASPNALERRTLHFFRDKTVQCIKGYFADPVWDRLVLQLCHSEPAIRHAVVALGALHEERDLRMSQNDQGCDSSIVKNSFPTAEYSRAIRDLQVLLKTVNFSLEQVLICALVFVHFESMRESFIPALMHIENAIKLLKQSTPHERRNLEPAIIRALMRMDVQSSTWLGTRRPGLSSYTLNATDGVIPTIVNNLTLARDLVGTSTGRLLHFMRSEADDRKFGKPGDIPLEIIAMSQDHRQAAARLDDLLSQFLHNPTARLTALERHGLDMLRNRVKMNHILAATCLYSEASMFDLFLDDFEQILTLCTYMMSSDTAERRLLTVSLDEGLLHSLFFVATHCRDSHTRRSALAQLRKLPQSKGNWHVEIMTRVAAACIEIEERNSEKPSPKCSDIAEWQRIHSAGIDGWFLCQGARKLTANLRTRPNGMDGEWLDLEEVIECGEGPNPDELEVLYDMRVAPHITRKSEDRIITWP